MDMTPVGEICISLDRMEYDFFYKITKEFNSAFFTAPCYPIFQAFPMELKSNNFLHLLNLAYPTHIVHSHLVDQTEVFSLLDALFRLVWTKFSGKLWTKLFHAVLVNALQQHASSFGSFLLLVNTFQKRNNRMWRGNNGPNGTWTALAFPIPSLIASLFHKFSSWEGQKMSIKARGQLTMKYEQGMQTPLAL